jgi:hypothetical protein
MNPDEQIQIQLERELELQEQNKEKGASTLSPSPSLYALPLRPLIHSLCNTLSLPLSLSISIYLPPSLSISFSLSNPSRPLFRPTGLTDTRTKHHPQSHDDDDDKEDDVITKVGQVLSSMRQLNRPLHSTHVPRHQPVINRPNPRHTLSCIPHASSAFSLSRTHRCKEVWRNGSSKETGTTSAQRSTTLLPSRSVSPARRTDGKYLRRYGNVLRHTKLSCTAV